MLNRSGEGEHPCVLPNLRRRAFNIQSVAMKYDLRCGFLIDAFYHVEEVPFNPSC